MYSSKSLSTCRQHGATLIEALVSILVLSLGLLGMAALQLNALSFQKSSWATHRIAELTTDIVERMQTNPIGSEQGKYTYVPTYTLASAAVLSSNGCRSSTTTLTCSPDQIASDDLSSWLKKAQTTLPGGAASVSGNITSGFVVTAMYVDKDFKDLTGAPMASTPCTSATTGVAWRSCCPDTASAPAGVRCSRTPFFVYSNPNY